MKWFRRHIKTGSRLALFALAVQFALSFGHFHPAAAQAASAIQSVQADLAYAAAFAGLDARSQAVEKQAPAVPDNDQQPADGCAICAVIALAGHALAAGPPLLLLPQAVEFLYLTTDAEFVHLNATRFAFQSRAPPAS